MWRGRNVKRSARKQIESAPVFILDNAMTRQYGSGVGRVAEERSRDWGIVYRPFPSWLIGGATYRDARNMNYFKSAKRKLANLVGLRKVFDECLVHLILHLYQGSR